MIDIAKYICIEDLIAEQPAIALGDITSLGLGETGFLHSSGKCLCNLDGGIWWPQGLLRVPQDKWT